MQNHTYLTKSLSPAAKRGFITIATGDQKYYQMAVNLLHSYRQYSDDPSPFSLICDHDCPEAREFDSFVLIENATQSYLDKLYLHRYTPYEETIFIDADSLILSNTQLLWDDFANCPDFSCYGISLSLDSHEGWFFYEDMEELKPNLSFGISMHGGLYFLRKNEKCNDIFEKALHFSAHYHSYKFACFKDPADEPVLALSMALAGRKPCPIKNRIVYLPSHDGNLCIDRKGTLLFQNRPCESIILHFGNRNIPRFLYQCLLATMKYNSNGGTGSLPVSKRIAIRLLYLSEDTKSAVKRILRKLLPSSFLLVLKKAMHK